MHKLVGSFSLIIQQKGDLKNTHWVNTVEPDKTDMQSSCDNSVLNFEVVAMDSLKKIFKINTIK